MIGAGAGTLVRVIGGERRKRRERNYSRLGRIITIIFWILTGCAHYILIKMSERGNGIVNSWLDLLDPY